MHEFKRIYAFSFDENTVVFGFDEALLELFSGGDQHFLLAFVKENVDGDTVWGVKLAVSDEFEDFTLALSHGVEDVVNSDCLDVVRHVEDSEPELFLFCEVFEGVVLVEGDVEFGEELLVEELNALNVVETSDDGDLAGVFFGGGKLGEVVHEVGVSLCADVEGVDKEIDFLEVRVDEAEEGAEIFDLVVCVSEG